MHFWKTLLLCWPPFAKYFVCICAPWLVPDVSKHVLAFFSQPGLYRQPRLTRACLPTRNDMKKFEVRRLSILVTCTSYFILHFWDYSSSAGGGGYYVVHGGKSLPQGFWFCACAAAVLLLLPATTSFATFHLGFCKIAQRLFLWVVAVPLSIIKSGCTARSSAQANALYYQPSIYVTRAKNGPSCPVFKHTFLRILIKPKRAWGSESNCRDGEVVV